MEAESARSGSQSARCRRRLPQRSALSSHRSQYTRYTHDAPSATCASVAHGCGAAPCAHARLKSPLFGPALQNSSPLVYIPAPHPPCRHCAHKRLCHQNNATRAPCSASFDCAAARVALLQCCVLNKVLRYHLQLLQERSDCLRHRPCPALALQGGGRRTCTPLGPLHGAYKARDAPCRIAVAGQHAWQARLCSCAHTPRKEERNPPPHTPPHPALTTHAGSAAARPPHTRTHDARNAQEMMHVGFVSGSVHTRSARR